MKKNIATPYIRAQLVICYKLRIVDTITVSSKTTVSEMFKLNAITNKDCDLLANK